MLLLINRSLLADKLIALNIKIGTALLPADLHSVSNRNTRGWTFVAEGRIWDDPSPEDCIQNSSCYISIIRQYGTNHNKQVVEKIIWLYNTRKILSSYNNNNNNMTIQVPRSMRIASLFFSSWPEEVLLSLWFLQMNILLQDYHSQIRSQAGPVIEKHEITRSRWNNN